MDQENRIENPGATVPATPERLEAGVVKIRPTPEARLFSAEEGGALGMEQYRLLAGQIVVWQRQYRLKRILVTSAVRGEGKTNVAANLALALAENSDHKTLLVDADTRDPDLHNIYGISNGYGLSNVMYNGRSPWRAVRRVEETQLYVMTGGTEVERPPSASSLLGLRQMMDQLDARFDTIVIDSPPVLLVADVPLLASMADGILFVVRALYAPRDLILKAKDMLEGRNFLGTVLVGVDPMGSYGESAYRGYGYPYGHKGRASKRGKKHAKGTAKSGMESGASGDLSTARKFS